MNYKKLRIEEYMNLLASNAPVPGGGPVAALSCAEGAGLCIMVCELSIGKKKFEPYSDLLNEVLSKQKVLKDKFLNLMEKDSELFLGMEKVFAMPRTTDEEKTKRENEMQIAFRMCCETPMEIMECGLDSLKLTQQIVGKSSAFTESDLEVSAISLEAGIKSAYVNVIINTSGMNDKNYAFEKNTKAQKILNEAIQVSKDICLDVEKHILK